MADRRWITDLAETQHGLATRTQLDDGGLSRSARRQMVASGRLERVGRATFRLAGAPRTALQRVMLACLDTGGYTSHRTGAWMQGSAGFVLPQRPEVTVGRSSFEYRLEHADVHTSTNIPADDVLTVQGIPCFSMARTLFSLAALVPAVISMDQLKGAVDDAVTRNLASDPWLWARLEAIRCRGRNGVSAFEQVLTARADGQVTESWLERETMRVFAEAGLPVPVCQARIAPQGAFVARIDFLFPDKRVVVEVSGHAWHRTKAQIAADVRRRRELTLAGYVVLEFTYDDVVHRGAEMVRQVRSALLGFRAA